MTAIKTHQGERATLADVQRLAPALQFHPGADELDLHNLLSARLQQASSITMFLMDHPDLDHGMQGMLWGVTDLIDEGIAALDALDRLRMEREGMDTEAHQAEGDAP